MAVLNKHEILGASDTKIRQIEVPEWGGTVCLRVMTVGERDAYENAYGRSKDTGGLQDFRTKFLVKCLCDENGARLFQENEVTELNKKAAGVMDRLWTEAMKWNGLGEASVEEAAKN